MSLYLKYFKLRFKCSLEYKTSFILSLISQIFVFFTFYGTIFCLFDKFSNVKGYTLYEVVLTFGIIQFGSTFSESFFRGIDQFDNLIIRGDFDRLLLRPRNLILQILGEEIGFVKLVRLIQSILLIIIALIKIKITWDIYKVITLFLMLLSSIILFFAILILSAAYCFLTVKGLEIRNVFTCGCRDMAEYPIGIFNKPTIKFFTYVLPLGFVNYYPLLYLLGKTNNKLYVISPLVTIIFLIISLIVFNKGIKKYSSTGS